MRKQLKDDTMTHRFLLRAEDFLPTPTSLVYLFTRGMEHNWTKIDHDALTTGCVRSPKSLSWHSQIPPGKSAMDWLAEPRTRFMYQTVIDPDQEVSVSLMMADFDMGVDASRSHRELSCLHEKSPAYRTSTNSTCYTSFERLGGYTVVALVAQLKWLAIASCLVSTVFAMAVVKGRGVIALLALAMSYGSAVVMISIMGIPIDMLLVAVMLVAPGLLVDFTMHLLVHRDASFAVLMSGVTSIVSVIPYTFMPVEGIRHFSWIYCLFIVLGMVHSFALVAASDMIRYIPVSQKELEPVLQS